MAPKRTRTAPRAARKRPHCRLCGRLLVECNKNRCDERGATKATDETVGDAENSIQCIKEHKGVAFKGVTEMLFSRDVGIDKVPDTGLPLGLGTPLRQVHHTSCARHAATTPRSQTGLYPSARARRRLLLKRTSDGESLQQLEVELQNIRSARKSEICCACKPLPHRTHKEIEHVARSFGVSVFTRSRGKSVKMSKAQLLARLQQLVEEGSLREGEGRSSPLDVCVADTCMCHREGLPCCVGGSTECSCGGEDVCKNANGIGGFDTARIARHWEEHVPKKRQRS